MPNRKSLRFKGFDYSLQGYYFVTICVNHRMNLLGEIIDGHMILNNAGQMIKSIWNELPMYYPIEIDTYMVMPNHFHGIVKIVGATPCGCPINKGQAWEPAPTISLPDGMHRFKSLTTSRYQHNVLHNGWTPFAGKLWQRNYYDRIIRHERELNQIRQYIAQNPHPMGNGSIQSQKSVGQPSVVALLRHLNQ